jgi:hypothetical protein
MERKVAIGNNEQEMDRLREEKPWEIVDVTFGKNDMREINMLDALDKLDREKKTKIFQVKQILSGKDTKSPPELKEQLDNEIVELVKQYKEQKLEYVKLQEEKLYEKWEITDDNGHSLDEKSIEQAYITFRSMEGKEQFKALFEHAEFLAQTDASQNSKMFFNRFLEVNEPCAPSSINWYNIQYTDCNRLTRKIIIWIVAVIVVVIGFYGMVRFKDFNDELVAGAAIESKCPKEPYSIDLAYEDYERPGKQRLGMMHCFCLTEYQKNGGDVSGVEADFLEIDPTLEENPCEEWKFIYKNQFYLTIISGALVGAINGICLALFENIVVLEKCLTFDDETKAKFQRVVIVQFLNIAALLLFCDFSLGYDSEETVGVPILQGKYRDFDT